jgi:hypothetical protein
MNTMIRNCLFLPLCGISMMLFVSSCDDEDELEIQYPETGFYGDNILTKGKTDYTTEQSSFQAKLPEGQKVKIIITGNAAFPDSIWGSRSIHNWAIYGMGTAYTQIFQSIDGGQTCVLEIQFNVGTYQIDYYENDATSPTYSKTIVVN